MGTIIDVATAKRFCQVSHSKEDDLFGILVDSAEEWVQKETDVRFYDGDADETADPEYVDGGMVSLWPKFHPINDITSIVDRENSTTYDLTDVRFDKSRIWQRNEGEWAEGTQRWLVTYKAGYDKDSIPAAFKLEILNMVKRAYDNRGNIKRDGIAGMTTEWQEILDSDTIARITMFSFRRNFF